MAAPVPSLNPQASIHAALSAGTSAVLGEIVERPTPSVGASSLPAPANISTSTSAFPAPVTAVIGRAFPEIVMGKAYPRQQRQGCAPKAKPASTKGDSGARYSAHIQPEDSTTAAMADRPDDRRAPSGAVPSRPVLLPAGGTASAAGRAVPHQWSPEELEGLDTGYYTVPITTADTINSNKSGNNNNTSCLKGEDYFQLLFLCLHSTVRKHQEVALQALLAHLAADHDLRLRCTTGPDCSIFLHAIVQIVATAGHPTLCQLAARCLVRLLQGGAGGEEGVEWARRVEEAVAEVGAPLTDAAAADAAAVAAPQEEKGREGELPFEEISELLRGEDAVLALEELGYTSALLTSMSLLCTSSNPTQETAPAHDATRLFLDALLCGGAGRSVAAASSKISSHQPFLAWVEAELLRVVMGERPLAAVAPLLYLLLRLAQAPGALPSLLWGTSSIYETWTLFYVHLFTSYTTMRTEGGGQGSEKMALTSAEAVAAMLLGLLWLREAVRQGHASLLADLADVVLSDGLTVGAAMVLEMWVAARVGEDTSAPRETLSSLRSCMHEAARMAAQLYLSDADLPHGEAALLPTLVRAACGHYLATYLLWDDPASAPFCCAVLPSLVTCISSSTPDRHQLFFRRLTMPYLPHDVAARWGAALAASMTHADARLCHAMMLLEGEKEEEEEGGEHNDNSRGTTPLLTVADRQRLLTYTEQVVAGFADACLGIEDHLPQRLGPDELCTLAELVSLLSREEGSDHTRTKQTAALFLLHGIAVTKHTLDAAPPALAVLLVGLADAPELRRHPPTAEEWVCLASNLQRAVAQAALPVHNAASVAGAARPWVFLPLAEGDTPVTAWAVWLRGLLQVHPRAGDILGWDALMSHLLLWCLRHRATLFEPVTPAGRQIVLLLLHLGSYLWGPRDHHHHHGVFSPAASRALGSELDGLDTPQAAEGTPAVLHLLLATLAAHATPQTALSCLRTVLQVPMVPWEGAEPDGVVDLAAAPDVVGATAPATTQMLEALQRWAGSEGGGAPPLSTPWDLETVVALLQVAAPPLRRWERLAGKGTATSPPTDPLTPASLFAPAQRAFARERCVALVVTAVLRRYLVQRAAQRQQAGLSVLEREVLRRTVMELDWVPAVLVRPLALEE